MAKLDLHFSAQAWSEYLAWQVEDKKTTKAINKLIKSALTTPFTGLGKPEPLKYNLQGAWSRRIDAKNRLVYIVTDTELQIVQLKFHYDK